jgi:hypothetical protein
LGQSLTARAFLALVASSIAHAQGLPGLPIVPPNEALKDVNLLFPQRPAAGYYDNYATIQWSGESAREEGPVLVLSGAVVDLGGMGGGDVKLRADSVIYNRLDQTLKATGSVRLDHTGFKMRCHSLEMKMVVSNGEGIYFGDALGVTFELPGDWTLNSKKVNFTNHPGDSLGFVGRLMGGGDAGRTTTFHFEEVSVSPCPDEKHNWSAKASSVHLKAGSYTGGAGLQGYATLKNTVLKIGPAPVMWMPWALFPARVDRAPGLLPPELGFSNQLGATLGMSYFQPLGEAADVTVSPTWYSKEGIMWGLESRWEPEEIHKGNFNIRYIRPKTTMEARYRANLNEIWDMENGWFVRADVNLASDQMMDMEFGRTSTIPLGSPAYDSSLFVGKNFKWASFSLFASDQRTFFQPDDPFYNQYFPASMQKVKMPEAQLRFYPISIGRFYLDGSSRVGRFGYYLDLGDEDPAAKYYWDRSDHQVRLQGRLGQWGPFRADLQMGARATQYSSVLMDSYFSPEPPPEDGSPPQNPLDNPVFDPFKVEGPSTMRWLGSSRIHFSVPQVGRSFLNLKVGKYTGDIKHILEPTIAFTFNSKNGMAGVFPRFDEADTRPGVGNSAVGERSIEFALKQHLFGRPDSAAKYADLLRFRTSIKYYYDPIILYDGRVKQGWGSLDTDIDVEPSRTLRMSFRRATDISEGTSDSSVSADVAVNESTRFGLAFFTSGINQLHVRQRGIRTGGSHSMWGDRLRFQFEVNYDFERKTFTQSQASLTYGSPCVAYSIRYYHVYLPEISPFRKEDRVDFSINLSKLGDLFSSEIGQLFRSK